MQCSLNIVYELGDCNNKGLERIVQVDSQLSQRDRAAGCVSFGQKW